MKFHHDTQKSKGPRGQKPFLYIDKCHDSAIDYGNLPINNPKRDIVGTNTNAKFEWNPFINSSVIERKLSADGRTYVLRTDRRTRGRPMSKHNTPPLTCGGV